MTHRQLLIIFLKHDKIYLRGNGNRTNIIVLANSMGFEKTKEKKSLNCPSTFLQKYTFNIYSDQSGHRYQS